MATIAIFVLNQADEASENNHIKSESAAVSTENDELNAYNNPTPEERKQQIIRTHEGASEESTPFTHKTAEGEGVQRDSNQKQPKSSKKLSSFKAKYIDSLRSGRTLDSFRGIDAGSFYVQSTLVQVSGGYCD